MTTVSFNRFVEQQDIPYTLIGVFINDKGKKETIGDHKDWDLDVVRAEFEKDKKKVFMDRDEMYKGKMRFVKCAKSLRFKYVEDWFIIDIDETEFKNIEDVYAIEGFDQFRGCPYKKGTTKGFHIFVKIKNLPKYKCETKVFKNVKGDLIKWSNNLWCYHNDDIRLFHFREENDYPEFYFEDIKNLFDLKRMNFDDSKTVNKGKKKPMKEVDVQKVEVKTDEHSPISIDKTPGSSSTIQKKGYMDIDYHNAIRAIHCLKIDRIDHYDTWIRFAYICMNEFDDEAGFMLWLEFSKRGTKFINRESLYDYWMSLKVKHYEGTISLGTLYYWAKEDGSFFMNEEDRHYYSKVRIRLDNIQKEYLNAIENKWDMDRARLVEFLYPDYFMSDGKILYMLNYYGIYKKIEGSGIGYMNRIFEGVSVNLARCITDISSYDGMGEDEKASYKAKIKKLIKTFENISPRRKTIEALIENNVVEQLSEKIDTVSRHLIGFENGVFDIYRKEFRKGTKDDFVSMSTGYNYYDFDSGFESMMKNRCYQVFASLFRTEEYTKHFISRLAYMMDGNKNRQEFDFFLGSGGNGKSLISESIISKVFGEYSTVMSSSYFMTADKDSGRATPELAQAKGARFVFVSEPDTNGNAKMQTNKLKLLSGKDEIKCRFLYSDPIRFVPQFSLIFLVNDFPDLSSIDGGILRRPVITEFPFLFRKVEDLPAYGENPNVKMIDMELGSKCEEFKLFFFKLLIDSFDMKYKVIDEVLESTNAYKEHVDPIGNWIKENYIASTDGKDGISLKDITDKCNISMMMNYDSRDVSKSLLALGYVKKKIHGTTLFNKIKLKEG